MNTNLLKIVLLLVFICFNNLFSKDQKFHLVEKGETLYSISKIYNVDVEEIKKLNNLSSNEISIGQKIIVDDQIEKLLYCALFPLYIYKLILGITSFL